MLFLLFLFLVQFSSSSSSSFLESINQVECLKLCINFNAFKLATAQTNGSVFNKNVEFERNL